MDGAQSIPSPASDNGNQRIVSVDCPDLTGIGVKLTELSGAIGRNNTMLIFDSLSPPYLLNENSLLKFMRATLARFAPMGYMVQNPRVIVRNRTLKSQQSFLKRAHSITSKMILS
jgi:hypothetical protein